MANSTRDIRERFPLIADENGLEAAPWLRLWLPTVLDARVSVRLPARDLDAFDVSFRLRLLAVSPTDAEFGMDGIELSDSTVHVPVYVGRDAVEASRYSGTASWLKVDSSYLDMVSDRTVLPVAADICLHPDCLDLTQLRPAIYVLPRSYTEMADDIDPQYPAGAMDISGSECVLELPAGVASSAVPVIAVADGKNTSAEGDTGSGTVSITGGAGLGLGMIDRTEWADGEETEREETFTGLRSVNGLSGDVSIEGRGAVSVVAGDDGRLIIRANGEQ